MWIRHHCLSAVWEEDETKQKRLGNIDKKIPPFFSPSVKKCVSTLDFSWLIKQGHVTDRKHCNKKNSFQRALLHFLSMANPFLSTPFLWDSRPDKNCSKWITTTNLWPPQKSDKPEKEGDHFFVLLATLTWLVVNPARQISTERPSQVQRI